MTIHIFNRKIRTKEDARQCAIDWQHYASKKSISYAELSWAQAGFTKIGKKFGLMKEFKENGIL
jgi:hypothetical protein